MGITLRAFMFLRSMPTSRVTPSPNLRLDAATWRGDYGEQGGNCETHLEGVLLLDSMDGRRELSELAEGSGAVWMRGAAVARTGGVLGGVDQTADGCVGRGHGWMESTATQYLVSTCQSRYLSSAHADSAGATPPCSQPLLPTQRSLSGVSVCPAHPMLT